MVRSAVPKAPRGDRSDSRRKRPPDPKAGVVVPVVLVVPVAVRRPRFCVVPARAAYSHSASESNRYFLPEREDLLLAAWRQGGSGSESVCNNARVAQDDERARIRTGGDFRERQVTVSAT